MTEITENDALNRVMNYCAASEHCRAEVIEKLQRWGIDYEAIKRILKRLEDEKYIDEERFCRAFIRDKYRFEKWGKMKIAQALQLKKIPYTTFHPHFNVIDEEEYFSILNSLLASKRKSIRASDEFQLNHKLMRFALSRGFEIEDIRRCIGDFNENEECD